MPAPLSDNLRRRVLDASRSVSAATVHRLRKLDRETGSVEPMPHGGGHAHLLIDDDRPFFDACLAESPSMPHQRIAHRFQEETGRVVSRLTVRRALKR